MTGALERGCRSGVSIRRRRGGGENGTVALLTLVAGGLVLVVAVGVVVAAADLIVTRTRAGTAADAAALAAAAESPLAGGGGDPRAVAARLADANGAELAAVDTRRWPLRVEVEVWVEPRSAVVRAAVPRVRARAAAALVNPDP